MTQKSILCYGDSNTWGYVPADFSQLRMSRYTREQRWPALLQKHLGPDFYIIEEGLNGRATNVNYHIPPDRNGKTYLPPCLYTHSPIDLVVMALGGNDYKTCFNRSPEMIRDGMAELIDIVQTSQYGPGLDKAPEILLISPPVPLPIVENFKDANGAPMMQGSLEKSIQLLPLYEELASSKGCYYLDVSKKIVPSRIDGIHLDDQAHALFAELITDKIKTIFFDAKIHA